MPEIPTLAMSAIVEKVKLLKPLTLKTDGPDYPNGKLSKFRIREIDRNKSETIWIKNA